MNVEVEEIVRGKEEKRTAKLIANFDIRIKKFCEKDSSFDTIIKNFVRETSRPMQASGCIVKLTLTLHPCVRTTTKFCGAYPK